MKQTKLRNVKTSKLPDKRGGKSSLGDQGVAGAGVCVSNLQLGNCSLGKKEIPVAS